MAGWAPHPSWACLPRPVAFVFSGGVALGAVQVGMARALAEAGVQPDLMVGVSVGAINAAYLAAAPFTPGLVDRLAAIWAATTTRAVFGRFAPVRSLRLALGGESMVSNSGVRRILANNLVDRHDVLRVPTTVIAARRDDGSPVAFTAGDLRAHVLASTAVPLVFPPVKVGGDLLVDGGLVANVPVRHALQAGARSLVILDAGIPCYLESANVGPLEYAVHLIALAMRGAVREQVELVGAEATVAYLPGPCPVRLRPHDFDGANTIIQPAYRAARDFIQTRDVGGGPGLVGGVHAHGAG